MSTSLKNSLLIVLSTAALAATLPSAASAAFPGENGKIAMGCGTLRNAICVTEPGSRVTTYPTDSGQYESMPSFSANGRRIVFARYAGQLPGRHTEIFVMRANGTEAERLTRSGANVNNLHPSFTPDGSRIVFHRSGDRIMIMAADGSGVEQIGQGADPTVSPSGERVAFTRRGDDQRSDLYTMAIDGSDVDPLTDAGDTWSGGDPSWSPDGEEIVFTYDGHLTSEQGIFSVPASDGDPERVGPEDGPQEGSRLFEPTVSPDGTQVAFLSACEDCRVTRLVVSALDGSGLTPLGAAHAGGDPDWGVRIPGGSPPSATCNKKQATIVGTNRDDSIVGTSVRDIISGRGGSDVVKGLAGNDVLCGGKGNDRITGGGGTDRCSGGGADRLRSCERRG